LTLTSSGRNIQRQGGRREIVEALEVLVVKGLRIDHPEVQKLLKDYPPRVGIIANEERSLYKKLEAGRQKQVATLEACFASTVPHDSLTIIEKSWQVSTPSESPIIDVPYTVIYPSPKNPKRSKRDDPMGWMD
jgi:hypothetical protein